MQFKYFVGIDTSKKKMDLCFYDGKVIIKEFIIINNSSSLNKLFKKLQRIQEDLSIENTVFCVEHTGLYNNHLFRTAALNNWSLVVEPAIQIKKSMGIQRGKNDRIDAYRIAKYAYKNREELRFWEPMSDILQQIKILQTQRSCLVKCKIQLHQSIIEDKDFQTKKIQKLKAKNVKSPVNSIEKEIKNIEKLIDNLIKSDPELERMDQIITSINGVGRQNSIQFLVSKNAFRNITDPRKYACYGGVAPFRYSSGSSLNGKSKVSKQANLEVKTTLQMAAINAFRCDPEIKKYYERKLSEGKHKMSVLNAIRNKIIHRVFACIRDNRLYTPNINSYT